MSSESQSKESFLLYVKDIKWYEYFGFLISLAFPLQLMLFYKIKKIKDEWHIVIELIIAGIALSGIYSKVAGLFAKLPGIQSPIGFWETMGLSCASIIALNIILFIALAAYDLPTLFAATARESVWKWENTLLGHKLWSGWKTYNLLKWLVEDKANLGRTKWLIVNFLSHDLEQRIVQTENTEKKEVFVPNQILTHGWSTRVYSEYLAQNMTFAEDSILWVVDPRDFIKDILPAHIIEVMISICTQMDPNATRIIQRAKTAKSEKTKVENLRNLLGPFKEFCPLNFYEKCNERTTCNNTTSSKCDVDLSFKDNFGQKHFDYLWFSFFYGTLNKFVELKPSISSSVTGSNDILQVGSQKIKFKHVKKSYLDRERLVGSLFLPHIEEFRRATCKKKRHIFLGQRPEVPQNPFDRAKSNIENWFSVNDKYIHAIFPTIDLSENSYGLFNNFVQIKSGEENNYNKVVLDSDISRNCWKFEDNVKIKILEWAIDLFAYTAGGDKIVQGVFVGGTPEWDYHDVGIYDKKLELFSEPGNGRLVIWRVYEDSSERHATYFPKDRSLLVDFQTVKASFLKALSGA